VDLESVFISGAGGVGRVFHFLSDAISQEEAAAFQDGVGRLDGATEGSGERLDGALVVFVAHRDQFPTFMGKGFEAAVKRFDPRRGFVGAVHFSGGFGESVDQLGIDRSESFRFSVMSEDAAPCDLPGPGKESVRRAELVRRLDRGKGDFLEKIIRVGVVANAGYEVAHQRGSMLDEEAGDVGHGGGWGIVVR